MFHKRESLGISGSRLFLMPDALLTMPASALTELNYINSLVKFPFSALTLLVD